MDKQAFIAMKFTKDPWHDKVYVAIRDVLEPAGYNCIRADEIRTSGPIVEEECRLLREADLVIIDSSGDSHSVSYEIGYCHGFGRPADRILLLRKDDNLPFNYRHYRHRVYRDNRHLKRLICQFLGLIEPIRAQALGYTYSFDFSSEARHGYILDGAVCVFDALAELNFTGRCECFSVERFYWGRVFLIGVMLRPSNKQAEPTPEFWKKLYDRIEKYSKRYSQKITLTRNGSEYATKMAMEASMIFCGAAQFKKGCVDQLFTIDDEGEGSFISSWQELKNSSK